MIHLKAILNETETVSINKFKIMKFFNKMQLIYFEVKREVKRTMQNFSF